MSIAAAYNKVRSSLTTCWDEGTTAFQNRYNKYVNWTSKYTIDEGRFSVKDAFAIVTADDLARVQDGTLKKVAKVFCMLIASILLLPTALLSYSFSAIRNCLCGPKVKLSKQDDQPASTPPATPPAPANKGVSAESAATGALPVATPRPAASASLTTSEQLGQSAPAALSPRPQPVATAPQPPAAAAAPAPEPTASAAAPAAASAVGQQAAAPAQGEPSTADGTTPVPPNA